MKPLRTKLTPVLFLTLNLLLPHAEAKNWWEKSRGGWNEETAPAKEVPKESLNQAESSLTGSEDQTEASLSDSKSDYEKEIAKRKAAANRAREAVKKPALEEDLQSLEQAPEAKAASTEGEVLRVKKPEATASASEENSELKEISELPKKSKKAKKKRSRRLASIESTDEMGEAGSSEVRVKSRSRKQEDLFRLGLLSGVAAVDGGGSLLNVALQGDYQSKYWGLELDGYYGAGLGAGNGTVSSQSQFGFFVGPKVNYTFGTGSFRFTPKAGVGYGMLSINMTGNTISNGTTTTASAKTSFSGVYAMAGFDMFLTRWLFLTADFATSVSASATAEVNTGSTTASGNIDGAQFQRIRAGMNFLLGQHFILGAQYYSRSLMAPGSSAPQNFLMGHLGYQF